MKKRLNFRFRRRRPEGAIRLDGRRTFGAEHSVWLNPQEGVVKKIPTLFGQLWQKMDADHAQRDLQALWDAGIPTVPTEVIDRPEVQYADGFRERVRYVIEQCYFADSHPMSYADLRDIEPIRRDFLEIVRAGGELRQRQDLGLDLLGGQALRALLPALNPLQKTMNVEVANLMIADRPVYARRDWPSHLVSAGEVVAWPGKIRQCDTRLYDFDRGEGLKDRLLVAGLKHLQDAQDTILWGILRDFGYTVPFDMEKNRVCRFTRWLLEKALIKLKQGGR
jgi:hypothetical protein